MRIDGPVFARGCMHQGRLRVEHANVFAAQLQTLRDGIVEIAIVRQRATRSPQANAFYWAALVDRVASRTGYTPREIHDLFKAKFLPLQIAVTDRHGEVRAEFVVGRTTATLSPAEFADYCREIEHWAIDDLGMCLRDGVLCDPEE